MADEERAKKASGKSRLAIDLTGDAIDVDLTGEASDSDSVLVSGEIAIDLTEEAEAIDLTGDALDSDDSDDSTTEGPDWVAMSSERRKRRLPQIPTKSIATKSAASRKPIEPKKKPITQNDPVHVLAEKPTQDDPVHVPATPLRDTNRVDETIPTVALGSVPSTKSSVTKPSEKEIQLRGGPQQERNAPTSLRNVDKGAQKPTQPNPSENELQLPGGPQKERNAPTFLRNMDKCAQKPTEPPTLSPQPKSPTKPTKPPSIPQPKSPTKLFSNGTPIWKQFEDPITKLLTWYDGQVVGYDPVEHYYKVQYSDGDIEEFTPAELKEQLKNYHSRFLEDASSQKTIPVDKDHSPTTNKELSPPQNSDRIPGKTKDPSLDNNTTTNKELPPNSGKTNDEISSGIQKIPATGKAANSNQAMDSSIPEKRNGQPLVLSTGRRLRPRVSATASAVVASQKNTRKRKASKKNQEQTQSDPVHVLTSKDPNCVHTVILDTMPNNPKSNGTKTLTPKEILLRGGSGPQYYGSSQNPFWNIVGTALGFQRPTTPYPEQVQWLTQKGYAVWDLLAQKRNDDGSLVPSHDLAQFVHDHPNLRRFVFVGDSAEIFKERLWGVWLRTNNAMITVQEKDGTSRKEVIHTRWWIQGRNLHTTSNRTNFFFGGELGVKVLYDASSVKTFQSLKCTNRHRADEMNARDDAEMQGRVIELMVIPSPNNSLLRPTEIEKTWHQACFGFQEPPEDYRCVGCELRSRTRNEVEQELPRHWLHDCPFREEWEMYMKQLSKQIIDPFYWYM